MTKYRLWKRCVMAGLLVVPVAAVAVGYGILLKSGNMREPVDSKVYQYHIAMIAEEPDTPFWGEVYGGAVEAAEQYGAYVEQVGDGLVDSFSLEESIEMAIYEKVDGILLRPVDGEGMAEMIDKAEENGIPVITMQKDVPTSSRQGFVGINDYFLGQEFGRRVLKISDDTTRLAAVLIPGNSFNETSRHWFEQGLINTMPDSQIQFDIRIIRDDKGLNNAEDVIHGMVEAGEQRPDIIICLDSVITLTASQIIHAQELSGQIDVIGSYVSDDILNGIKDGTIDSSITVDSRKMGQMSVEALMSYREHHLVSYYTEVGTRLVDQHNVEAYWEETP